jgi:uncharacterized membrane protein
MKRYLLLFGPLAGLLFFATVYVLALSVPNYSHFADTVSEIGQVGSPVEQSYRAVMLIADLCLIALGVGLYSYARSSNAPVLPAVLVAYFGIMQSGLHFFPSPHQLHNLFGLSLIIGYLAPLSLAIAWQKLAEQRSLVMVTWSVAILLFVSIFLNISPIFVRDLYPLEYYGLVQRSSLLLIFGWFAYVGIWSFMRAGNNQP